MTLAELIELLAAAAFSGLVVAAGVVVARTTTAPLRLHLLAGTLLLALIALIQVGTLALTALDTLRR